MGFIAFFCGAGTLVSFLLLQGCQSLPVDVMKFTASNNVCVGATENVQQSDEIWLRVVYVLRKGESGTIGISS